MFNPSKEQVRRFFCDAWQKKRHGQPLLGAEIAAAEIAERHPEYHALLSHPDLAVQEEWSPEVGQMNPFLHLSLHLAVHEQVSIDQPIGVRAAHEKLASRLSPHEAEHVLLECLAEVIWAAQRNRQAMDAPAYIDAIQRRASALSL